MEAENLRRRYSRFWPKVEDFDSHGGFFVRIGWERRDKRSRRVIIAKNRRNSESRVRMIISVQIENLNELRRTLLSISLALRIHKLAL